MSDIIPINPLNNLSRLSERELEVLRMFCDGLPYKDIAKGLHIALGTVKTYMGNIYVKLGLDQLKAAQRRKILYQEVCSAMKNNELESPSDNQKYEMIEVPPEVEKMVDEDESALLALEPELIDVKTSRVQRNRLLIPIGWGLGCGIIMLIVGAGLIYFLLEGVPFLNTNANNPDNRATESTTNTTEVSTPTSIQEDQIVPTQSPELSPLNDYQKVPASFVFEDDFEDGIDEKDWHISDGLGMAKGKLTIIDHQSADVRSPYSALVNNHVWGVCKY